MARTRLDRRCVNLAGKKGSFYTYSSGSHRTFFSVGFISINVCEVKLVVSSSVQLRRCKYAAQFCLTLVMNSTSLAL